jgi:hypothetical protein
MSDVIEILDFEGRGKMAFFACPGCRENHCIPVEGCFAAWQWNGDRERPTFSPSILVRATKMTPLGEQQYREWMNGIKPCPEQFDSVPTVCHSFVRDGKIEFLSDCTHELKGKTVDLESVEST